MYPQLDLCFDSKIRKNIKCFPMKFSIFASEKKKKKKKKKRNSVYIYNMGVFS